MTREVPLPNIVSSKFFVQTLKAAFANPVDSLRNE